MESQTVLFVDDDEKLLDGIRISLRRAPFDVHTACGGREALAVLRTVAVDVLVSDQQMPGMTGIELVAHVRRVYPTITPLLLSGEMSCAEGLRSQADLKLFRVLTKPIPPEKLWEALSAAFRSRARLAAAAGM